MLLEALPSVKRRPRRYTLPVQCAQLMPTIDDVAREAGVGIGTVSRVINNSPFVSKDMRQRVLAAIDRLGYQPSRVARAFGRRQTHTLEVLVPVFLGTFFLEILRGIEEALADDDYTLLARTIDTPEDRDRAFEACCSRGRADGALLLWTTPTDTLLERLAAQPFPIVLANVVDPRLWSVGVDHDAAARAAVEYCARIGHRRIALVDRRLDVFESASEGICGQGYRDAMHAIGLEVRDDYERIAELSQAGGARTLETMMELSEPPTAVVVASEAQAIGAFLAARDRGWQVPAELSIVGYSDSPYAAYLGLTTIDVPLRDIGREATRVLLGAIAEPNAAPQTVFQPSRLVVRRTCGARRD